MSHNMVEYDQKQIDCPEHLGKHTATLYVYPHKLAGTWECPTGYSDACQHESSHVEETESWPTSPVDIPRTQLIYVCDACEITLEGDPALDNLEDYEDD